MFWKVLTVAASVLFTWAITLVAVKIFASALAIAVGTPVGVIAMVVALYALYSNERRKQVKKFYKASKSWW